jgi:histidine ammonia-lyase
VIREVVEFLDIDRSLAPDHTKMQHLVKSCRILEKVEEVVGDLAG